MGLENLKKLLISAGITTDSKAKEAEKKEEEEKIINFNVSEEDDNFDCNSDSLSGEISSLYSKLEETDDPHLRNSITELIAQKKEKYENETEMKTIESYIEQSGISNNEAKELYQLYEQLLNTSGLSQKTIIQSRIDELMEDQNVSESDMSALDSFISERAE